MDQITDSMVDELLELLKRATPGKAEGYDKAVADMRRDKAEPVDVFRTLLGSALDWIAYGN